MHNNFVKPEWDYIYTLGYNYLITLFNCLKISMFIATTMIKAATVKYYIVLVFIWEENNVMKINNICIKMFIITHINQLLLLLTTTN